MQRALRPTEQVRASAVRLVWAPRFLRRHPRCLSYSLMAAKPPDARAAGQGFAAALDAPPRRLPPAVRAAAHASSSPAVPPSSAGCREHNGLGASGGSAGGAEAAEPRHQRCGRALCCITTLCTPAWRSHLCMRRLAGALLSHASAACIPVPSKHLGHHCCPVFTLLTLLLSLHCRPGCGIGCGSAPEAAGRAGKRRLRQLGRQGWPVWYLFCSPPDHGSSKLLCLLLQLCVCCRLAGKRSLLGLHTAPALPLRLPCHSLAACSSCETMWPPTSPSS